MIDWPMSSPRDADAKTDVMDEMSGGKGLC